MHRLATAALALIFAVCAPAHAQPAGPTAAERAGLDRIAEQRLRENALAQDPPRDQAHPARNRQLVIPSGPVVPALGRPAEMNALMMVAAGDGPKPTLLLLHGLPGNERNLDLAQAARRAGWNVLTFTYRGAWGSEGMFSIEHAVADTEAALAWLRSEAAVRDFKVDPARIVIGGHSMGGYMAAHVAAADVRRMSVRSFIEPAPPGSPTPRSVNPPLVALAETIRDPSPPLAGVILIDAWDIAATARELKAGGAGYRAGLIASIDDIGHSLGVITAADIADELTRRGEEWNPAALGPVLARMPVLVVYATHGGAAENKALAEAIAAACVSTDAVKCPESVRAVELVSDHAFADKRLALAQEVVGWLSGMGPQRR